jgi:hypothetical protein
MSFHSDPETLFVDFLQSVKSVTDKVVITLVSIFYYTLHLHLFSYLAIN